MSHKQSQSGLTAIELLITLFVAFLFIAAFYRLFTIIDQNATEARWQSTASNIGYTNLRKYTGKPSNFVCNSQTNMLLVPSSTPGQVIWSQGPEEASHLGLPGQVYQEIRAYAPYGCDAALPIILHSTVKYGNNREFVHATYVD